MTYLLSLNKLDVITSICIAILSFYILRKFVIRKKKDNNNNSAKVDSDDDDDIPFRTNVDKRSLRPSYARFMRRKLQQELNNDSYLCVICWNDRKTVVLLPCRHLCVCVVCSKKLWNGTENKACPICRNEVDSLLEVFA